MTDKLDEKGIEALVIELRHHVSAPDEGLRRIAMDAVHAYLAHTTSADAEVAEMVKRLRERALSHEGIDEGSDEEAEALRDAAALIERLAGRVPKGWKMVPTEATAENGMKYRLIGDIKIRRSIPAYEDGIEEREVDFILEWTELKDIYRAMLSAAPPFPKEESQS